MSAIKKILQNWFMVLHDGVDAMESDEYEELQSLLQPAREELARLEAIAGAAEGMASTIERMELFIRDRDNFEKKYGSPKYPDSSIWTEEWLEEVLYSPIKTVLAAYRALPDSVQVAQDQGDAPVILKQEQE